MVSEHCMEEVLAPEMSQENLLAGREVSDIVRKTSRPIPRSVAGWFKEIKLARADARGANSPVT